MVMAKLLTDQEIDDAVRKLAAFRARSAEEDFLQKYADLLVSYQQLRNNLEEEKIARKRYKQLVRTQERNPFALVIVDGDGYIFKDEFLQEGPDGGTQAAHHLNSVVKKSLREKGLGDCDVMIRIYANLTNLSRFLFKNGLTTADKRSLSPFVANFNRSFGLTDFVDAGELKENADFKIRALLSFYAENSQCKHIYFAACHDVGYISDLTRFRGDRSRVTLIRSSGLLFHDQFLKLDLGIEELPSVFRTIPLDSSIPYARTYPNTDLMTTEPSANISSLNNTTYQGISSWENQKICQFYQSGKCRFGADCKNSHVDNRISVPSNSAKLISFSPPGNSNVDIDIMSSPARAKPSATTLLSELDSGMSGVMPPRADFAYQLPDKMDIPDGHVAA
ncbi:putative ccch zinc finger DNA binding protein [Rosellinia necatrix]|uniref:Putative ccch zinc finger DNA binding protein n=1 Tax=Rosellinia necatrix TaxID=77044 RepID=A0A1W2TUR0_ROSNE|nr:putative ccch zinc finger DNA binding protein [Rosellinia necatrix]